MVYASEVPRPFLTLFIVVVVIVAIYLFAYYLKKAPPGRCRIEVSFAPIHASTREVVFVVKRRFAVERHG